MDKARTGNLIKEARISKNLTQSELGAVLGVSNKAVSRWENGDSFPDVGILENLAETLGLTIEDIVSGGNAGENSDAISDVIHIVKIQKVEKSQRNRRVAGCVLELCVCLVAGCRGLTEKSGIGVDDLLAVGAAYSIMINCSLFYNVESRVHVLPALTTCTLVIVGVTVAAAGILCLCHKTRQRSLNN